MPKTSPTRLLYLDTEFTSLGEPWPSQLISAALVDSAGKRIFYAEADDFDPGLASDFTRSRVIPLLDRGEALMPYAELCEAFFAAVEKVGEPCALAADSAWDWLWVQMMAQGEREARGPSMRDDPSAFPLWPQNLSPKMATIDFDALPRIDKMAASAASGSFMRDKYPHHALVDARRNALACLAAIDANPGLDPHAPAAFCAVFKQSPESLAWTPRPASRRALGA